MNEIISAHQLRTAAKGKVYEGNMNSVLVALDRFGVDLGMNKPHILAQFFPRSCTKAATSNMTARYGG
ncbi:hypothetical protein [Pararhizobium sp.]|uniref:hypothetical protein n=1 Tax=Pararhizobium sp. TaxID=1977563 RepID=UPI003D11AB79